MKNIMIHQEVEITSGVFSGKKGKIVGYASDEVWIELENHEMVTVKSVMIKEVGRKNIIHDIPHITKYHKYAIAFLTTEIADLRKRLEYDHLLDNERVLLEAELSQLERDFKELSQYAFTGK